MLQRVGATEPAAFRRECSEQMSLNQKIVIELRVVHGLALSFGAINSGRRLVGVLRSLDLILPRHPSYIALYTGLVVVNLFIAWSAWLRFGRRSLRASIASYIVWLPLFIWHGWYTDFPPFALYTDYPLALEELFTKFTQLFVVAAFYCFGYALFPILCYLDKRCTCERERSSA